MRVTVSTEALAKALSRVGVAADSTPMLPILNSVLIVATKGQLQLSVTNLDIYITENIQADVKVPGKTVVAHRLLSQFMGRAQSQTTKLDLNASMLVVNHGDNIANFEPLPVEEFPPNLELDKAKTFTCDALDLIKPFKAVAHAISRDESRYTLMGVSIKPTKKGLEFAATDGRRVALYRSELQIDSEPIIVPERTVLAIIKAFDSREATLSISPQVFGLCTETTEIRSKLIEGSFPNYDTVIPEPTKEAFSAKRDELIEAVRTASLFLSKKEIAIRIEGKGKELEVGCYDKFKTRIMGTELSGQPKMEKHFNFQFILDSLNVLENEAVRIEVTEEFPVTIREGKYLEVIRALELKG